jgi:NADH-quinone oxidoreductase subunit H
MTLAWKVLLPLGLVSLVVVAVWTEYGRQWAGAWGVPYEIAMAAWGWAFFVVAMAVVLLLAPAETDNRPRPGNVSLLPPDRATLERQGAGQ